MKMKMPGFYFVVSIFILQNMVVNAAHNSIKRLQNQYTERTEKRCLSQKKMKERLIEVQDRNAIDKELKILEDKEQSCFSRLHEKYPCEVKSLLEAFANYPNEYPNNYPYDIEKLIIEYVESPDYLFNQTLTATDNFTEDGARMIRLLNGDMASFYHMQSIKVWRKNDNSSWNTVQTLEHPLLYGVTQLINGDLISSSVSEIKIWRLDTDNRWNCVLNLPKNRDLVSVNQLKNGDLIFSYQRTIKTCHKNIDNSWEVKTLSNDLIFGIFKFELDNGDLVFNSSWDSQIRIFRKNQENEWVCVQILNRVSLITRLKNGDLISSYVGSLNIWRKSSDNQFRQVQVLQDNELFVYSMIELNDGYLATFDSFNNIKLWRFNFQTKQWELKQILTNSGHLQLLTELSDGNFAFSSHNKLEIYNRPFGNFYNTLERQHDQSLALSTQDYTEILTNNNIKNEFTFTSWLYHIIKNNPFKTAIVIGSTVLMVKYRNHIAKLFKK